MKDNRVDHMPLKEPLGTRPGRFMTYAPYSYVPIHLSRQRCEEARPNPKGDVSPTISMKV